MRNGLSCFGCHTEGMKTFEDEVRSVIESNTTPAYDKAQALRLYVAQSEMGALVQEDTDRYRGALEATGGAFGGIEPISRFHEVFQGPVDAAYAAAVVGLETEAFLQKIRENIGLQNVGLLVLDSANGSMKRDAWTSNFRDILFALDFPKLVDKPVITPPDRLPGTFVQIPDPNLRTAIAEELGKSPNAPITVEEMERLRELDVENRGLRGLTGIQFATNLSWLYLRENQISDISPLAGLVELVRIDLSHNPVSDMSPLRGLKNLNHLSMNQTLISDISLVRNLPSLTIFGFRDTHVSDLSPLTGLINMTALGFSNENLSDLSPLAGLINLKRVFSWGNSISDLSPLSGLTKLEIVDFCGGDISDLTPLAGLTGLKELYLAGEEISDISPLAGLTGLTRLGLENNNISDVSPLAGLTNLKWLHVANNKISNVTPLAGLTNLKWLAVYKNEISDFSPLDGLRENLDTFIWGNNPGFRKGGPKIEGPWLWVVLPDAELDKNTDLLSKASGGTVTEIKVATHGATEGKSVGDEVWTSHRLPPTGIDNIADMLKRSIPHSVIYGSVSVYSPRRQETTMYIANDAGLKVWLNGTLVYYEERSSWGYGHDYEDFFPVTLQEGRNILLVAVGTESRENSAFFGFEPGTEYTVLNPGVGYVFSKTPIHTGDTFTLDISAEDIFDLAGWQFDIAFDPAILETLNVSEGNFLKTDGGTTFFQSGRIDNAAGKIAGLSAARLSDQGVSGTGTLLQVRFKAKSGGETQLVLQNFQFGAITGENIPAGPHEIRIVVEGQLASGDVNRDGVVSILDLILVARQLGKRVPAGSAVDVNGDGVVSILDLIRVAQGIAGSSAAPVALNLPINRDSRNRTDFIGAVRTESIDAATIEAWIAQARLEDDGSLAFKQGIENLQKLLASLIPEDTALLRNYPNPFNPETWIPYQLAHAADVTFTIYDTKGVLVRRLDLGYQQAGYYTDRTRAAYWDGRNHLGESVGSGVYFYQLRAGDYSTLRKMVILK